MGRIAKKIVVAYCLVLLSWLPVSVAAASIDCLFHESDSSSLVPENLSANSSHQSAFDLSDIDFSSDHMAETMATPDSSCSTNLIAAALPEMNNLGNIAWEKSHFQDSSSYQLTNVLLPRDIRPPISI